MDFVAQIYVKYEIKLYSGHEVLAKNWLQLFQITAEGDGESR
jgi:hypothetical protein